MFRSTTNQREPSFAAQQTRIYNLPVEVLEIIFDYLPVSDLKSVSLVCKRWSIVAFTGRRMGRVKLKVDYSLKEPEDYVALLRESKRLYRNVLLCCDSGDGGIDSFLHLLQPFKNCLTSLQVWPSVCITMVHLRAILLEVPNLKALSLQSGLYHPAGMDLLQFPVLNQLSDLLLDSDLALRLDEFNICKMAPNLQCLDMDCNIERALDVYNAFSDRLKALTVFFRCDDYFHRFCELNFPQLEKLDFYCDDGQLTNSSSVRMVAAFIARLKRLQTATFRCNITQPVLDILVENCADIRYLHVKTDSLEKRAFARLAEMKRLKTLILDGWLRSKIFDSCKPLIELHELRLRNVTMDNPMEFFRSFPMIAQQLRVLDGSETDLDDICLQFICTNFLHLHRLVLEFCPNLTEEGFQCLNRLPQLRDLSLGYLGLQHGVFHKITSHTITRLSLFRCDKLTDEDLLHIPHALPMLTWVEIQSCHLITLAGVQKLRSLIPWCTVLIESILH